jgi:hypothetical protein
MPLKFGRICSSAVIRRNFLTEFFDISDRAMLGCIRPERPRQLVQGSSLVLLSNSTETEPGMRPQAVARWGSRGALLD